MDAQQMGNTITNPIVADVWVHCRVCGGKHEVHAGILGAYYLCDCVVHPLQEGDDVEYEKVEVYE